MKLIPKLTSVAAVTALALVLTSCAGSTDDESTGTTEEKTSIKIGFNPGPYEDMFNEGIAPILEDQGYSVEAVDFTDGVIVNVALGDGEIDANIMQHSVYMDAINEQEGLTNASLVQVPGPPMALFGGKKSSLKDVGDGSTVAVPNNPSNLYRALQVLADVGWITLSDTIDPATASPADVAENPHNLQFVSLENAQQVPALQDVDYDVIQGNFVVSGGLDLTEALYLEDLTDEFSVIVAVDENNVETPWAQAIKDAYESPEFAEYIASNTQYEGYHLPDALES
jgi:D-methionine transport system substrate-binding protein